MTIIAPRAAQVPPGGLAADANGPEPAVAGLGPTVAADDERDGGGRTGVRRIGVVFVHGIGGQQPGETLLDWSRPLIRALTEWRTALGVPPDPVVETSIDFSGASAPSIELDIPAAPAGPNGEPAEPQRWLLTEAWWASRVRPPSLGTMTGWLRGDFGRVVEGIRAGYRNRAPRDMRRRALLRATDDYALLREAGVDDPRWAWIDRLDALQARVLAIALGAAWILGALLLLPYAALRALPIPWLRDAVVVRQLDSFLVDWFGDMRILLHDQAQAANIRARLAAAIECLVGRGCDAVVLVAHSGGAVVAFTTLTDPRFAPLPVTKLVTLGQGLDLAWRLEDAWRGLPAGDRLVPAFGTRYPCLRWVDVWASYDPAPGGPLAAPSGVGATVEDVAVRNRMSLLEDHGAYWDNDEEFVIPLLRQLDAPDGPPSRSRFFRSRSAELVRVERRRQRVGVLAAWRWVCLAAAVGAIAGATLHAWIGGSDRLRDLGAIVATVFGAIPGSEAVAAPLDWAAGLLDWPAWLPSAGERLLGLIVAAVAFALLARIGIGRWEAWDARERWLGRSEPPRPLDRGSVKVQAVALVAAAIVLAIVIAVS